MSEQSQVGLDLFMENQGELRTNWIVEYQLLQ